MLRLSFRVSVGGAIAAGLFLSLAIAAFCWVFFVASKNPADSGESALILLPFAMPWIMILPRSWAGPWLALGSVLFNVLLLYLVFGGLRFTQRPR